MSGASQSHGSVGRSTVLFLSLVIAVATVGFFAGINDGVPGEHFIPVAGAISAEPIRPPDNASSQAGPHQPGQTGAIPAASYSQMRRADTGPTSRWKSTLDQIPQPAYDLFAELKPSEEEKQASTLVRASRRAFNGAPPIIPHAVERTSDAACFACHGHGLRIGDRVAQRMSHEFLANCLQCHAPPPPTALAAVDVRVENTFVGLPAPTKGERAFPGAPPTIPHSTWMREQCLACHGGQAGWPGLESTHPWRSNCQQCHAPSAKLEQAVTTSSIGFLPPPVMADPDPTPPDVSGGNVSRDNVSGDNVSGDNANDSDVNDR